MADIAELELRVKSSEAERAAQVLAQLTRIGNATEQMALGLNTRTALLSTSWARFGSVLKGIGFVAAARGLSRLVTGVADAADQIRDVSRQTGISVEQLSKLKFAAEQNGASFQELSQGLRFAAKTLQDFQINRNQDSVFALLGEDIKQAALQGAKLEDLLPAINDRLRQIGDTGGQFIASKLFSRGGITLLPTFKEDLRELGEAAERAGAVISGKLAEDADKFNDSLVRLDASWEKLKRDLVGPSLEPLAKFFDQLGEAAADTRTIGFIDTLTDRLARLGVTVGEAFSGNDAQKFIDKLDADLKLRQQGPVGEQQIRVNAQQKIVEELRAKAKGTTPGQIFDPKFQAMSAVTGQPLTPISEQLSAAEKELASQIEVLKGRQAEAEFVFNKTVDPQGPPDLGLDQGPAISASDLAALAARGEAIEKMRQDLPELIAQTREETEAIELEASMIGKSNDERQIAIDALQLEQKAREAEALGLVEEAAALREEAAARQASSIALLEYTRAQEKLIQIQDQVRESAKGAAELLGRQTAGALADVAFQAKSAKDAAEDLLRTISRQALENTLGNLLTALGQTAFGATGGQGTSANALGGLVGSLFASTTSAKGNAFERGSVVPFMNGGIVDTPSAFSMSGGRTGTIAEMEPEGIVPLKRMRSGRLGVETSGGPRVISVVQNIRTQDANSFRKSKTQIARDARDALGG